MSRWREVLREELVRAEAAATRPAVVEQGEAAPRVRKAARCADGKALLAAAREQGFPRVEIAGRGRRGSGRGMVEGIRGGCGGQAAGAGLERAADADFC